MTFVLDVVVIINNSAHLLIFGPKKVFIRSVENSKSMFQLLVDNIVNKRLVADKDEIEQLNSYDVGSAER